MSPVAEFFLLQKGRKDHEYLDPIDLARMEVLLEKLLLLEPNKTISVRELATALGNPEDRSTLARMKKKLIELCADRSGIPDKDKPAILTDDQGWRLNREATFERRTQYDKMLNAIRAALNSIRVLVTSPGLDDASTEEEQAIDLRWASPPFAGMRMLPLIYRRFRKYLENEHPPILNVSVSFNHVNSSVLLRSGLHSPDFDFVFCVHPRNAPTPKDVTVSSGNLVLHRCLIGPPGDALVAELSQMNPEYLTLENLIRRDHSGVNHRWCAIHENSDVAPAYPWDFAACLERPLYCTSSTEILANVRLSAKSNPRPDDFEPNSEATKNNILGLTFFEPLSREDHKHLSAVPCHKALGEDGSVDFKMFYPENLSKMRPEISERIISCLEKAFSDHAKSASRRFEWSMKRGSAIRPIMKYKVLARVVLTDRGLRWHGSIVRLWPSQSSFVHGYRWPESRDNVEPKRVFARLTWRTDSEGSTTATTAPKSQRNKSVSTAGKNSSGLSVNSKSLEGDRVSVPNIDLVWRELDMAELGDEDVESAGQFLVHWVFRPEELRGTNPLIGCWSGLPMGANEGVVAPFWGWAVLAPGGVVGDDSKELNRLVHATIKSWKEAYESREGNSWIPKALLSLELPSDKERIEGWIA